MKMANKLACFLLSMISFSWFIAVVLGAAIGIDPWCSQTPYPDACKYHFAQHGGLRIPTGRSDFKKMSIQVAMNTAMAASAHTQGLGPRCTNPREKAAWDDCVSLYEDTVLQLNKTLSSPSTTTGFDQQTWLSAALTNLETCKTGFVELGVSGYILPLVSNNNVSKLICNSLALNANNASASASAQGASYEDGFPTWIPRHDRKLLQSSSAASSANLVVAQDGSGNYKTIGEALTAAASRAGSGRFIIHIKAGVYAENIATKLKNIMLIGDGVASTIITGSRSVVGGSTTFNSATFAVTGGGFIAQGITFRNTAGPSNHQAVALRSGSDLSVFYQCGFEGYQDTLYTYSLRQFYKGCNIYGTVDFIFGNAAVVFQGCNITYPGRPWRAYSRTVVMETYLDSLINAAGWLEWDGTFALSTLFYAEYHNSGPGSSTAGRVKWPGYKVITSSTRGNEFIVANFIAGIHGRRNQMCHSPLSYDKTYIYILILLRHCLVS
ncbi:hypothetical protein Dimus_028356 [Dionaea muscipula]